MGKEINSEMHCKVFDNEIECYPQIREAFLAASDVRLFLIDGQSMISHRLGLLCNLLDKKVAQIEKPVITIRTLLLSPQSQSFINAEIAAKMNQDQRQIRRNIEFAIQNLSEEAKQYQGTRLKISFQLYDEMPIWKLLILDDVAFVRAFAQPEGFIRTNMPMYRFQKAGASLFQTFVKYFDYVWDYKSSKVEVFNQE
jgi:hypothetical protein